MSGYRSAATAVLVKELDQPESSGLDFVLAETPEQTPETAIPSKPVFASQRPENTASSTAGAQTPEQLIASCQGLVRTLAWKIHRKVPSQVDLDDLIGYGQIGLAEAARDFDTERGRKFTTYAYHRVRGAILDGLSSMSWFSKADYYRGRYEQEAAAAREAEDDANCDEAKPARSVHNFRNGESEDGSYGANAVEASEEDSPVTSAVRRELIERIHRIVDTLPSDEQQFIRCAYFEGMTLTEAGQRLGISRAWASRLHTKILNRLAQTLGTPELVE